jgi:hypothetical protein
MNTNTKFNNFSIVIFLVVGLLFSIFQNVSAEEPNSYSILNDDCSKILLGPTGSYNNFKFREINKLKGDNFCLKISSGEEDGESKDFLVRVDKQWLVNNKIENVSIGDDGVKREDGNLIFQSSEGDNKIFFQIKATEADNSMRVIVTRVARQVTKVNKTASQSFALLIVLKLLLEAQSFTQLRGLFVNFVGFLLFWRKKRVAGVVYDANNGKPVSLATISVVGADDGKVKEVKTTDKNGAYFFLVKPGRYFLKAGKKGYKAPHGEDSDNLNAVYSPIYKEEKIIEAEGEQTLIEEAIPLIGQKEDIPLQVKLSRVFNKIFRGAFLEIFFWAGFGTSIFALFVNPSVTNFVLISVYGLFFLFQRANFQKIKWGTIFDKSKNPVMFAFVNIFSADGSNNFSARTITDDKGRYSFILEPGEYKIKARSTRGGRSEEILKLKRKKLIGKNLILED